MSTNDDEIVDFEPLEDKIYNKMEEVLPWSMVEVEANFPTYDYWPLYRAWQKLQKQNRVTFYRNKGKRKYFMKASTNKLPHIKFSSGGTSPLSIFVENIEQFIDPERGVWAALDKVNKVPLLFGQLFVLADHYTKEEWLDITKELGAARTSMSVAISWIDSVLDHPSMSGNEEKFKAVFGGKDAPDQDKKHTFMRFANKFIKIVKAG